MRQLAAAVAVLVASIQIVQAQEDDIHAEVVEWVVEPCAEVAAAYSIKSYTRDYLARGVKREHIAGFLTGTRDAWARDLSSKMADLTWEKRRAAYPIMLKLCLQNLKDAP